MTDLVLSSGQAEAMDMIARFLGQNSQRVAVLTGFAGCGKSTLIGVMEEAFGAPAIVTPTGKAALRVTEITGLKASTIHKLLYKVDDHPETGEPLFTLRDSSEIKEAVGDSFIIVDEASMVDQRVWGDLLAATMMADVKILLIGDRFQLPPITKEDGKAFCALDFLTPFSVNMTEIVRQALDSPIIHASMLLRTGQPEYRAFGLLNAVHSSRLIETVIDIRSRGGVVLVHRNKTRHMINTEVRKALGYEEGTVEDGEPLLVTQNSYQLNRFNGEIVTFEKWFHTPTERTTKAVLDRYTQTSMEMAFGMGCVEGGLAMLSPTEIVGKSEQVKLSLKAIRKTAKYVYEEHLATDEEDKSPPHLHAQYGYGLTTHKSQGSQFPEVLVVMEPSLSAMPNLERRRWTYTGLTRAQTKVSYLYLKD